MELTPSGPQGCVRPVLLGAGGVWDAVPLELGPTRESAGFGVGPQL